VSIEKSQPALSTRPRLAGVSDVILHDPNPANAKSNAHVVRSSKTLVRTTSTDEELIRQVHSQNPDLIVITGAGSLNREPLPFQIELAHSALFIPILGVGAEALQFVDLVKLAKTLQNISRDELSHGVLAQWTQHFSLKEGELGRLMLYKADAGWGILSVLGRKDPLYFREPVLSPKPGELFRVGKVISTVSGDCATGLVRLRDSFASDSEPGNDNFKIAV
jgi:hypothetical protein